MPSVPGTFLVRESQSNVGCFVLSVVVLKQGVDVLHVTVTSQVIVLFYFHVCRKLISLSRFCGSNRGSLWFYEYFCRSGMAAVIFRKVAVSLRSGCGQCGSFAVFAVFGVLRE